MRPQEAAASAASGSAGEPSAGEGKQRQEAARLRAGRDAARAESERLRRQVGAMEAFLRDYGMVWVGEEGGGGGGRRSDGGADEPAAASSSQSDGPPFEVAALARAIAELNILAGEGSAEVSVAPRAGPAGAGGGGGGGGGNMMRVLRGPPRALALTVYRDGLTLEGFGGFRPYHEPSARQLLADVLDGYFPAELRESHPEGVPFALTDATDRAYKPPFQAFSGAGRALAGPSAPSAALPSHVGGPAARMWRPEGGQQGAPSGAAGRWRPASASLAGPAPASVSGEPPISRDKFLSKLPSAVIRNGRIIDVRGSIGAMLAPHSDAPAAGGAGGAAAGLRELVLRPSLLAGADGQTMQAADLLLGPARMAGRPGASAATAAEGGGGGGGGLPPRPSTAGGHVGGGGLPAVGPTALPSMLPHPPLAAGHASFVRPVLGGGSGSGSAAHSRPSSAGGAGEAGTSGGTVATVHVKREDGGRTYVLRLRAADSVADLRRALDALRQAEAGGVFRPAARYEIRSAFPAAALSDPAQTLEAAGLVPNGTLFLRAL